MVSYRMTGILVYGLGLTVLALLGVLIGRRLPVEYRTSLRPSLLTIAMVWAFLAVHFSLVVVAVLESACQFSLPQTLALSAGLLLIAVGAAVYLSAAAAFRSLKRMNFMDATRLVTDGIYRWSRNPQAVGWVLVLLGLGLARRSGMVLVLAAALWLSFRLYLPLEEELLRRLYGDAYDMYERHTHRYFGAPRARYGGRNATPPNKRVKLMKSTPRHDGDVAFAAYAQRSQSKALDCHSVALTTSYEDSSHWS